MSRSPGDKADPVAAQIRAEIDDHLATSAERLQSQGLAPAQALQKSHEKFGDPAAITRRCYWIKQGDSLMFRTATIGVLVALCLALGFITISTMRSQRQMADQMTALAEQLKMLADQKIAAPAPTAEQPPQELSGQVYIGTSDKPAVNKELMIVNAKDASIVRRVKTDGAGKYRSGPLPDGDYCLVTSFQSPARVPLFYPYLQTAPIFVYPGLPAPGHDLNVAPQSGQLQIELSRELPSVNVDGKYTIEARLMVEVTTRQRRHSLWTSSMPMPPTWPLHVMNATPLDRGGSPYGTFFELLSNEDLAKQHETTRFGDGYGLLPAGPATVVAAVIADVIPLDYQRPELRLIDATSQFSSSQGVVRTRVFQDHDWQNVLPTVGSLISGPPPTTAAENAIENDDFYWMTKGLGKIWLGKLQADESAPKPQVVPRNWLRINSTQWECHVPISPGSVTRLRIDVPANLEQAIKDLVESFTEADEFAKYTLGGNAAAPLEMQQLLNSGAHPFLRKVNIAVAGTEPL